MENPLSQLPIPLLGWYQTHARDLPWRREVTPYRVWVSEIMLQQTRVAAVVGYFTRFLEAFPTVQALAAAPEDRLMKLWQGLGYYSRARNLQKAARQIMDDYLKKNDIEFKNVMYTSNLPAIIELVSVGYGVSFMFEPHLRHRLSNHPIDCYSFGEPRITDNFVAAYRKGSYLPVYARDFIELVRRLSDAQI